MKSLINGVSRYCFNQALGLLLIRVITGVIFFTHGWMKFQGMNGTEQFFGMLGLWPWLAPVVATVEVLGGLMLIAGVLTRVAGFALGIVMFVAVMTLGFEKGFAPREFEALLAAVSFGIALAGGGRYGLFPMECRRCGGMKCRGESGTCPAVHA